MTGGLPTDTCRCQRMAPFPAQASHFDSITVSNTCAVIFSHCHLEITSLSQRLKAPRGVGWGLCCEHRWGKTWRPSRWLPGCQNGGGGLPVSLCVPERQKGKVSRQIERRTVANPNLISNFTEGNRLLVQLMETTW